MTLSATTLFCYKPCIETYEMDNFSIFFFTIQMSRHKNKKNVCHSAMRKIRLTKVSIFYRIFMNYKSNSSFYFKISNIVIQSPSINVTGFDLLSYDIQRGRDVGLPPYTSMRRICGLPPIQSFEDLSDHIPSEVNTSLLYYYKFLT